MHEICFIKNLVARLDSPLVMFAGMQASQDGH
jgi:hypothetical protein